MRSPSRIRIATAQGPINRAALLAIASKYRLHIRRRAADHLQNLGGRGLLLERSCSSSRAFLHLALQAGVRLAQLRGHPVELVGERLQLVAGPDVDLLVEVAGADARGAFLQRADRVHHAAREPQCDQRRDQQAGDDQRYGAQDRRVERLVHLVEGCSTNTFQPSGSIEA